MQIISLIYYVRQNNGPPNMSTSVLVFQSCHNKIPQSALKTAELYSLTVLQTRNPKKNDVSRARVPVQALEENTSLPPASFFFCF